VEINQPKQEAEKQRPRQQASTAGRTGFAEHRSPAPTA